MSKKTFPIHPVALYDNDPIERKATAGPLIPNLIGGTKTTSHVEISEVKNVESDLDRQIAIALKKVPKEASISHEGRINIITQV